MCLGIPGQVLDIVDEDGCLARVAVNGVRRVISTRLLAGEPAVVGDWVLIHVGFAMAKIDEAEAEATQDQVRRMGSEYVNELEAFSSSQL